jgi:Coenzyme PQQ synthesis protein D (PqqD)
VASAALLRINSPTVVHETFEDEVVIVNLENGNYYSFDKKAGADIWALIERGATVGDIEAEIAASYESDEPTIAHAVGAFLEELQREGLVVFDGAAPDGRPSLVVKGGGLGQPRPRFETPVLNKYSDMRELLLLDPIHEVDEAGWPKGKPPAPPA